MEAKIGEFTGADFSHNLAGLPEDAISRAREILENMEKRELDEVGQPAIARRKKIKKEGQLSIFDE